MLYPFKKWMELQSIITPMIYRIIYKEEIHFPLIFRIKKTQKSRVKQFKDAKVER